MSDETKDALAPSDEPILIQADTKEFGQNIQCEFPNADGDGVCGLISDIDLYAKIVELDDEDEYMVKYVEHKTCGHRFIFDCITLSVEDKMEEFEKLTRTYKMLVGSGDSSGAIRVHKKLTAKMIDVREAKIRAMLKLKRSNELDETKFSFPTAVK